MKNKILSYILISLMLFISAFSLSGCGEKEEEPTDVSSEVSQDEKEEKEESEKEKPKVTYTECFKKDIEAVISRYGKYVNVDDTGYINGLKYGTLIDFEKDGVPELLLLHDCTVEIYRFDGKESNRIFSDELGSRYLQSDVSTTFGLNTESDTPYVIVYHSKSSWVSEALTVFTLKKGQNVIKKFYADIGEEEPEYPLTDGFVNFKINNKDVSEAEYKSEREKVFNGEKEVDANWEEEYPYDNFIGATEKELNDFLKQFGL